MGAQSTQPYIADLALTSARTNHCYSSHNCPGTDWRVMLSVLLEDTQLQLAPLRSKAVEMLG